jgi:hypothetical protein
MSDYARCISLRFRRVTSVMVRVCRARSQPSIDQSLIEERLPLPVTFFNATAESVP